MLENSWFNTLLEAVYNSINKKQKYSTDLVNDAKEDEAIINLEFRWRENIIEIQKVISNELITVANECILK